jgi:hypothetical protein
MYLTRQIKIFLIFSVMFHVALNAAIAENRDLSNFGKVEKNIKDSNNLYIEKIGTYSLEKDGCSICWELKSKGLEGNQRLIYDAGMIYFSISLLN